MPLKRKQRVRSVWISEQQRKHTSLILSANQLPQDAITMSATQITKNTGVQPCRELPSTTQRVTNCNLTIPTSRDNFVKPSTAIWSESMAKGWAGRQGVSNCQCLCRDKTWRCQLLLTASVYPAITYFQHDIMSVCARGNDGGAFPF